MTDLRNAIASAHRACLGLHDGRVADYIPELALADPQHFALAACSTRGELHVAGDADVRFTIQSMCKPFLLTAALSEFGRDEVLKRVGVEPLGEAFNSFIRLESSSHKPHNPMINAGAIAVSGLLASRFDIGWLLDLFSKFAGRALHVNMPVMLSEANTGDRNRAIAYLLRYFDNLDGDVDSALELYFQACSIEVDVKDLAVMAATLANQGVNPSNGQSLLSSQVLSDVLRVMTTCGLYDGAGRFVFDVGVPAKSGVSGGVFAAVPLECGVAAYSPRLNQQGNSVRGMAALQQLSRELNLHILKQRQVSLRTARLATAPQELQRALEAAAHDAQTISGGQVAAYAPELARADASDFAACIVSAGGQQWSVGNTEQLFSLQAASNPFTYALALQEHGSDDVHQLVGVEPSGNPFDAVLLDPHTHRPFNPLANAGAITIASMIGSAGKGSSNKAVRLKSLLTWMGRLAGSILPVDSPLCTSEQRAGDRNRAIAHLLRNFGVIDEVDPALSLYFQQCSLLANCQQLARMGATLAANGRNPATGEQVLDEGLVHQVLSVMLMCGMHDQSGKFAFDVGIPAKSGVSGCIVAVVPGRYGIAVYSPAVDATGTSVRGRALLENLSKTLHLGIFDAD